VFRNHSRPSITPGRIAAGSRRRHRRGGWGRQKPPGCCRGRGPRPPRRHSPSSAGPQHEHGPRRRRRPAQANAVPSCLAHGAPVVPAPACRSPNVARKSPAPACLKPAARPSCLLFPSSRSSASPACLRRNKTSAGPWPALALLANQLSLAAAADQPCPVASPATAPSRRCLREPLGPPRCKWVSTIRIVVPAPPPFSSASLIRVPDLVRILRVDPARNRRLVRGD